MKNLKALVCVTAFAVVLFFPSQSSGKIGDRIKSWRESKQSATTVKAPVNKTTCVFGADGQCLNTKTDTPTAGNGPVTADELAAVDGSFYTLTKPSTEAAPEVPAAEGQSVAEPLSVDAAAKDVVLKREAWAQAEDAQQVAMAAAKQAAIARSREAAKEITRLTAQIEKLREQVIDLEPTPEE